MLNIIAYNKIYTKVECAVIFQSKIVSFFFRIGSAVSVAALALGEKVAPLIEKVKAAEETTESAKLQLREADAFEHFEVSSKKFTCTIMYHTHIYIYIHTHYILYIQSKDSLQ